LVASKYRLEHLLGEGGMGQVWAAVHTLTGRQVAIKRLRAKLYDEHAQARFVREARAVCSVDHPNIVQVIDFIEQEDEPALMVMELLRGETLGALLARERRLSPALTIELMTPVASALGAAHAKGIVHRDLKPANIFIGRIADQPPQVKVLDFGVAKWAEPGQGQTEGLLTQSGCTLGTPSYMAPEQALAERDVDQRADIWSLGAVLYECLAGRRAVEGANPAQVQTRLLVTGIAPLASIAPDIDPELTALVDRMLARSPSRRPQSCAEVVRVLARSPQSGGRTLPPAISEAEPSLPASAAQQDTRSLELASTAVLFVAPTQRQHRLYLLGSLAFVGLVSLTVALASVRSGLDGRTGSGAGAASPGVSRSGVLAPAAAHPVPASGSATPGLAPPSVASGDVPSAGVASAGVASSGGVPTSGSPSNQAEVKQRPHALRPAPVPSMPSAELPASPSGSTTPPPASATDAHPPPAPSSAPAPARSPAPPARASEDVPARSRQLGAELPFDKTNPYD
jgi:serine/threonine-protein kinase